MACLEHCYRPMAVAFVVVAAAAAAAAAAAVASADTAVVAATAVVGDVVGKVLLVGAYVD